MLLAAFGTARQKENRRFQLTVARVTIEKHPNFQVFYYTRCEGLDWSHFRGFEQALVGVYAVVKHVVDRSPIGMGCNKFL